MDSNPTPQSRPKITSSSFDLGSTAEKLGGKKKTIKISNRDKLILKNLVSINETLNSILKTLTDVSKEDKKLSEKQRKDQETKLRSERERGLESKVFDGIKTAVGAVMKPFTSIWDWIVDFFLKVLLGKTIIKLLNWFSDPKNKDKIKNIIRFFENWWPTMLGAYLLFGTSFGRLARVVVSIAVKSVVRIGVVLARLLTAIARGKALKVAGIFGGGGGGGPIRGGGGWKGALGRGLLNVGASVAAGFAIQKGTEALMGGGEEKTSPEDEQAKIDVPDSPEIPMLQAATGGLADIGKMFGKFGGNIMGPMFGPLGMLMGSMMGGNIPNLFQGLVSGKKGTDKIPAMLTDGEFVMSKGAVQKYGVSTLEAMNAAGGGTNIPKIVKGIPHAVGGGLIGRNADYTDYTEDDIGRSRNQQMNMERMSRNAQAYTVRVETSGSPGSGVLVKNDKGNYTVLTAGHVIDGSKGGEEYGIVTPDGQRYNVPASNGRRIGKDIDMGMIKFYSKKNYPVAKPGTLGNTKEDPNIFVAGFPQESETMPQSLLRFTSGKVMPTTRESMGYNITYNNPTFAGMSGGPVFNSKGELVAIHGRKTDDENTAQLELGSQAMPISHYSKLFGDQSFGSTETNRPTERTAPIVSVPMPIDLKRKEDLEAGEQRGVEGGYTATLSGQGESIYNQNNSFLVGTPEQIRPYQVPFAPTSPLIDKTSTTNTYNLLQQQQQQLPISRNQGSRRSAVAPPTRPAPIPILSGMSGGGASGSPITSGSSPMGDLPPVSAISPSPQSRQSARQRGIV